MTTPIPDLPMPYGATLVPTTGQNANYLDVATKGNVKVVGATGIYVPKGVFHLRVSWPGPNALSLMRNFTDGTLRTQHTIIPAGGGRTIRHSPGTISRSCSSSRRRRTSRWLRGHAALSNSFPSPTRSSQQEGGRK